MKIQLTKLNYENRNNYKYLHPDGLNCYIFHLLTGGNSDNLCETVSLEEGACTVLKGSAPVRERREMFLKIYEGCKKVADYIKKDVGWQSKIEYNEPAELKSKS